MNVGIWSVEMVFTDVVRWPDEERFPKAKAYIREGKQVSSSGEDVEP